MGDKVFIKNQFGLELVHGTPVAAAHRLTGSVTMGKDRTPRFPEDATGRRGGAVRSVVEQIHADAIRIAHPAGAYFEALPAIFSIGLVGGVVPVEQTAGEGDYLWDFTPDLTADNEPDSITLEIGDNTQAYQIPYVMARRIVIEGNVGESAAVNVEAECFGKEILPAAFTPGIELPEMDSMVANLARIRFADDWAGLATAEVVTGLLRKYRVEILTGVHPKFWAEGVKTMTGHGEGMIAAAWTLTFEGNEDADAIWDAFRGETPRAIRLELLGAQIGEGETSLLQIDTYGKFEEVLPLGEEQDGNNLHTGVFAGMDDNDETTPHMLGLQVITSTGTIGAIASP